MVRRFLDMDICTSIFVTNNVREFGRVKGLKVENWTA
jgi:predicted nucleic acid-binding protein